MAWIVIDQDLDIDWIWSTLMHSQAPRLNSISKHLFSISSWKLNSHESVKLFKRETRQQEEKKEIQPAIGCGPESNREHIETRTDRSRIEQGHINLFYKKSWKMNIFPSGSFKQIQKLGGTINGITLPMSISSLL